MNLLQGPEAQWDLWSTRVFLSVVGDDADLVAARTVIDSVLADVELAASRFRPDSDVCRIARADGGPVQVSPMTIDLVSVALTAAEHTGGLVDPTLGAALLALGYDRTISEVQRVGSAAPVVTARADWRSVAVDEVAGTVTVPQGVLLDLGATAKARAADLAAAAAHEATGRPVIVGIGGDLAAVDTPPGSDGWPVRIAETPAETAGDSLPTVTLASAGMATSTTQARRWQAGGQWVHHLIDPRRMQPVTEVWRTATVVAATCCDANTASTAALVLGDEASAWLAGHGLPARLVSAAGQAVAVGGWPKEAL